ncbi:hypothetical protein GM30_05355 [Trabulsiella odontotermitis]|nr:hypothetical protein GM30_05355 [Trabulsiella odontotermitis]
MYHAGAILQQKDLIMTGKPAARQGDMTAVGGPIVQGSFVISLTFTTLLLCKHPLLFIIN